MKNKIISIFIVLMFLFTSLISVDAIARTPRIDLDEYQIEATDKNNVYITGTITPGVGQLVGLYDSEGKLLYNYTKLNNSSSEEEFKIQIPATYLNEGNNTFKIKSLPIKGVINSSNPKTINVKIKSTKKDQVINASNLNLKIGESKNVNATVDSNLPLTYVSENPNIATVDSNGKVVGRSEGTTRIVISQIGNEEYSPANKKITVVVSNGSSSVDKKIQSITTNFDKYQFGNIKEKKAIKGKASSGLKLTYKSSNSKVATVNSTGVITAKKAGTATITITQNGNSTYKATSKKVTITVPKVKTDNDINKDIIKVCDDQIAWMKGAKYGAYSPVTLKHTNKSLSNTEKQGTCVTYVGCVLQRLGLLKSGQYIWQYSNGDFTTSRLNNNYKSAYGVSSKDVSKYLKVKYVKGKAKTLYKNEKLNKGDIILWLNKYSKGHGDANGHIMFFSGINKNNGRPIVCEVGQGKPSARHKTRSDNKTLCSIVHIQRYNIITKCVNGTITPSQRYIARPPKSKTYYTSGKSIKSKSNTITIKYNPSKGKKIKSIKIDGKSISVKKHPKSYTFNKLDKNHTVEVVYN